MQQHELDNRERLQRIGQRQRVGVDQRVPRPCLDAGVEHRGQAEFLAALQRAVQQVVLQRLLLLLRKLSALLRAVDGQLLPDAQRVLPLDPVDAQRAVVRHQILDAAHAALRLGADELVQRLHNLVQRAARAAQLPPEALRVRAAGDLAVGVHIVHILIEPVALDVLRFAGKQEAVLHVAGLPQHPVV